MSHAHHHHHPAPSDNGDARYREIRKVTLIGSAVDLILAIFKLIFGYIGSSQALIADGIHSLSDLGTDVMVVWAAKHASRDADPSHPYGHARIETIATVILGITLVAVALGIAWDAVNRLFEPDLLLNPGWMALAIAAISVVSKEIIYRYTIAAAKRLRSHMLHANAWHSRTDAISSVIVIIGVGGAMMGLGYLDAIAAIAVAFIIAKIGWELSWHSIQELSDAALDQERVKAIEETILAIGGVRSLHMLRTRRMGGDALVDVHILVEPYISVSEGHQISEKVRATLIDKIEEVTDVMVHIDPEDDEHTRPNIGLPLRSAIIKHLEQAWLSIPEANAIDKERITLHYLSGKIYVEITLPLNILANIEDVSRVASQFSKIFQDDPLIAGVDIRYQDRTTLVQNGSN